MKLYEIADSYLTIERFLNEAETDEDLVILNDALVTLQGTLEEKVENIVFMIKNEEADVEALKNEEKRLNQKRKVKEKKIENLKAYILDNLQATGTERIKYPHATVTNRLNPESVNVTNESEIPSDYFIEQEPKLDKTALKNAMKSGQVIPGVELVRNRSLQIR